MLTGLHRMALLRGGIDAALELLAAYAGGSGERVIAEYTEFNFPDATTLGSVSPEFTAAPGHTDTAYVYNNRLRSQASVATPAAVYLSGIVPKSPDYEVAGDLYVVNTVSGTPNAGVVARASTTVNTKYLARWRKGNGFQLHRCLAGTYVQLGSDVAAAYTQGQSFKLRLRVTGTLIEVYRDAETEPLISVTDANITEAGRAGVWIRAENSTDGANFVNWQFSQLARDPIVQYDAIWTWFNDPRAVSYNGNTYIGSVSLLGSVRITKINNATGDRQNYMIKRAFEPDDHDNCVVHIRQDGKIQVMYTKHASESGKVFYTRTSTNAEDITEWGAETVLTGITADPVTYCNVFRLSDSGRVYDFYRRGNIPTTADFSTDYVYSDDDGANWVAGPASILGNTVPRPYVKSVSNGVNRVDFFCTDGHPDAGYGNLYHFYGQLDGADVLQFYKSDGTAIGATVTTPAAATQIWDDATYLAWVWDIAYGPDGNPWVLFVKFVTTSDHRYIFSRWTGEAWTDPVEIAQGGGYLYAGQPHYSAGLCFDAVDSTHVYASVWSGTNWEIQEFSTSNNGASWEKRRDLTYGTAGGVINARPYSPRNHTGEVAVLWWSGTYTDYNHFNTKLFYADDGLS